MVDVYYDYYLDKDKVPELSYKEFLEIRDGCFSELCCDFWSNAFRDQERMQKLAIFIDRYAINTLKKLSKSKNNY